MRSPLRSLSKQQEGRGRRFYYERLMRVSIRNDFYNRDDHHECPDFRATPTETTAELLRSLGLLFKDEGTGFSILYDLNGRESLFSYLRRQGGSPASNGVEGGEVWTRLSFVLSLKNPYFINFTRIPIDLDPVAENFYFTNQDAFEAGGHVFMSRRDGPSRRVLLPVIPVQVPIAVSANVKEVRVLAISGDEVMCRPRCVPALLTESKNPASITCEEAAKCMPGDDGPGLPEGRRCKCATTIYLDFSLLPEDKYSIERIDYEGRLVGEPIQVLYTTSSPVPLCFIDLLFTDPTNSQRGGLGRRDRGVYPVVNLWGPEPTDIVSVDYLLDFKRRSTFWNYFVVPEPQSEVFEELSIETVSDRAVSFAGPCCVHLANGSRAYRFVSEEELPLQQQSDFRFRLLGRHGGMAHTGVLVDRMPVASADQVIPDREGAACLALVKSLCDEASESPASRKLIEQICGPQCRGSDLDECLERLKLLGAEFKNEAPRRRRRLLTRNYSDIYVYV